MEQIYCVNCLRRTPAYPCPLCGYDPAGAPAVPQALEQCILHGRYLTGRVLEKNGLEMVYQGRDLAEDRSVILREFFPAGKARRKEDGSLAWTVPPRPEEALPPQPRHPGEGLLDSFSENNTIYTVCQPAPARREPRKAPRDNEWLPLLLALLCLILMALAAAVVWAIAGQSGLPVP